MNALAQATEAKGGITAASALLGVSPQRLSNWISRGVPVEWCVAVEREIGASRQDLRPDDWHLIWPELAEPKAEQGA